MTPGFRGPRYWDVVATHTWGRYLSELEATAIDEAQAAVPGPGRALDVGCGGGRWTRRLLDRGWSVTSLDVDAEAMQACALRNPEAERLLVAMDNRPLPVPDASVALVICIEVRAVVQSDWFLPEVRRVLVPGGRLVMVAWNRWSLRGLVSDVASRLRHGSPHSFYQSSYRDWRRRLRAGGLAVAKETGLAWFPFGRTSDSSLVPAAVTVEHRLGLRRLPTLSPWVLVTAERPTQDAVVPGPGAERTA